MNPERKISQRGAFLLPNLLTTAALFAGFYSIIAGINGAYAAAAIAVVVAGVLDGLDGRVARMTNTQSDFGVQYDSLADLISFGLAPALLAFNWSLRSLAEHGPLAAKLGWLAAFMFVACAALRLARFNSQPAMEDKSYFQGLASPAAAGGVVVTVWFCVDHGIEGASVNWLIWLLTVILAVLMISRVRYYSFKKLPQTERVPIAWIFLVVLAIVLLSIDPPAVLMSLSLVYVSGGLLMTLIGRRNRQARRARRKSSSRLSRKQHAAEEPPAEESAADRQEPGQD
jgi:CDP-diacylglycerol--serine O-phosphatidyltransferase